MKTTYENKCSHNTDRIKLEKRDERIRIKENMTKCFFNCMQYVHIYMQTIFISAMVKYVKKC